MLSTFFCRQICRSQKPIVNRKFCYAINKKLKELKWVRFCLKWCTDFFQLRVRFRSECNKRFIFSVLWWLLQDKILELCFHVWHKHGVTSVFMPIFIKVLCEAYVLSFPNQNKFQTCRILTLLYGFNLSLKVMQKFEAFLNVNFLYQNISLLILRWMEHKCRSKN